MKVFSVVISTLFIISTVTVTMGQGIQFHQGDWASALAAAQKENKTIFVDAFTVWCGPCKMMDKQTFPDPSVGTFYNAQFINVKMDMEKGEGIQLAQTWNIHAYPTLLFFNPKGEMIHRVAGYHRPDNFLALGETVAGSGKTLVDMEKRYQSGDNDPEFLMEYAFARYDAMDGSHAPAAKRYLATQQNWKEGKNMEFIFRFAEKLDDTMFLYMVHNKKDFDDFFGKTDILNKFEEVIEDVRFEGTPDWDKLRHTLTLTGLADTDRRWTWIKRHHYLESGQIPLYVESTIQYFKQYPTDDSDALNEAAWSFYEHVDDPKALKQALVWATQAVKLDDNYFNNDTLAALYAKTGKKAKAKKTAQKAIALAQKEGLDHSMTDELLKKLN